ncbi:MAG: nucleotidyltransferase domain-containing protein [Acidobacteriota bacterium]
MTKQIDGKQEIGGVPILRVRDWLSRDSMRTKSCLVACFHRWKLTRYEPEEQISHRVDKLMNALFNLGYIVQEEKQFPDESHFYRLTKLGEEFARASGAKRLKRETAAQTLERFMSRVAKVNADARFLVRVTRVVVYGSFVRGEETVGDLDLAVGYESKVTGEERKEAFKKHFKASGRVGRGLLDVWQWPELEVKLFLKNRKRTISLHSFYDFQTMPKADNFSYEVLLGDPEKIKADLLEGETMEKAEAF